MLVDAPCAVENVSRYGKKTGYKVAVEDKGDLHQADADQVMERYVATFHTHLAAMRTCAALKKDGLEAKLAPVPRRLSSSCGTCVFYQGEDPRLEAMDRDVEARLPAGRGGLTSFSPGERTRY